MKVTAKSRTQYRIQFVIFILLLLGCIGFASWVSIEYNTRSDWTAGKRHSLSDDTIELLKQLNSPVSLRSYQADNAPLIKAISEILQRYQNNKADFNFEIVNPDIFVLRAKADGVEEYGQTIIEYKGQKTKLKKLTEETISNALIRLHRGDKPQLLFLSQHGERNIKDNSGIGYSLLASKLTDKGFIVSTIDLLQQNLKKQNTVLVISSINKPLLPGEQDKLIKFIDSGGNLIWLQDPGIDPSQQLIADALQIEFTNGVLVDNNEEVSRMLQLSHPAIIPVLEYKLHPITQKMQYFTLFTTATGIRKKLTSGETDKTKQWNYSDLLISSVSSWSEMDNFILGVEFNKEKDLPGPLSLGIAQQRSMTSSNATSIQRIVVIGDSDFLANNNLGNGGNLDFITKSLNWLTEDDRLISISPKNAPDLQLKLSATSASVMGIIFLIALPLFFFISGGAIWYTRSKR